MHYTLCLFSVVSQITVQAANHLETKSIGPVFLHTPQPAHLLKDKSLQSIFFLYATEMFDGEARL